MSARKRLDQKQDAHEIGARSSEQSTTSSDVIERRDPAPEATHTPEALGTDAASPLDAATSGTGPAAWVITTLTGSRYVVVRAPDGVWWFGGKNQPNPRSVALPPRLFRIDPPWPWPPVLGVPLRLFAADDLYVGDPERAPQGGKITSNVQRVEAMSLRAALERVGGHDGN